MLKLYQNSNFRGYSVTIDGNINKDDGSFIFNSFEVFPNTEIIIYNRNNDLFIVHNGLSNKIVTVNNLSNYINEKILNEMNLSFKVNKIKSDGSSFIKDVSSGKVSPLSMRKAPSDNNLFNIIIFILACFGIYFIYTSYIIRKINQVTSNNIHSN